MYYVELVIKLIIAVSILNVWLIRYKQTTPYRGGNASNIKEEFLAYGLPTWFMMLIGLLKVTLSLALIASIWLPKLELISSLGIAALMLGAVVMHVKIGDPIKKAFPAFLFLVLSIVVYLL